MPNSFAHIYPLLMKNSVGHFHVSGRTQSNTHHSACLLCKHWVQLHLSIPVLIYLSFEIYSQPSCIFLLVQHSLTDVSFFNLFMSSVFFCSAFDPFYLPWCCLPAIITLRHQVVDGGTPRVRACWQLRPLFCQYVQLLVVVLVVGAYQHCSHEGLLYSNPHNGVPSFISRGAAHQAAWETSASEGRD
jgi:hypothetical protein